SGRPADVNYVLPVGGLGCDATTRAELVRVGVQRARDHYGTDFDRVVVIGDTPRDADCARANGYAALLVAPGPFDASALARCGADAVREDLSDTGAVLDTIA